VIDSLEAQIKVAEQTAEEAIDLRLELLIERGNDLFEHPIGSRFTHVDRGATKVVEYHWIQEFIPIRQTSSTARISYGQEGRHNRNQGSELHRQRYAQADIGAEQ
jgi:hypothetical protein